MKLEVVGGTYVERCQFPEWNEVFGSGLRAAAVARTLNAEVNYHTCICSDQRPALDARCHELGIYTSPHEIDRTHLFEYVHGLSTPNIFPTAPVSSAERSTKIEVEGEAVMAFGMLEANVSVRGKRVVYDPQNPHDPEAFSLTGSSADSLAIVCNSAEGRRLTNCVDPVQIAEHLISSKQCEVAVLKCGSRGAIVSTIEGTERVPAYETKSVWPIGSGDVFAGAFAVHWAVHGQDPVEAARLASLHTANYCETKRVSPPSEDRKEMVWNGGQSKQVYLAGPFFSMPQIWLINESLRALASQGFKVFSPLHHVGRGAAKDVYAPDIAGIEKCDLVFACVDGLDAGTLFEIGYAKAKEKPVVAFVQNEKQEDLKMLEGSECFLERDFVTAIYRASWAAHV